MDNSRLDKIKNDLNNDIYKKIESLENLYDDTISSTEKLVNILDGYMSELKDFDIEEDITTMEVVVDEEVDIEVEDEDMLREYNEQIHEFGLDTLTELLAKEGKKVDTEENKFDFNDEEINQIIDDIDDYKTQELKTEELTQTLEASEQSQIEINDINFDEEVEKSENKEVVIEEPIQTEESTKKKRQNKQVKKQTKKSNEVKKNKKQVNKKQVNKKQVNKKQVNKKDGNIIDLILTIILIILTIYLVFTLVNLSA